MIEITLHVSKLLVRILGIFNCLKKIPTAAMNDRETPRRWSVVVVLLARSLPMPGGSGSRPSDGVVFEARCSESFIRSIFVAIGKLPPWVLPKPTQKSLVASLP